MEYLVSTGKGPSLKKIENEVFFHQTGLPGTYPASVDLLCAMFLDFTNDNSLSSVPQANYRYSHCEFVNVNVISILGFVAYF